MTKLGAAYLLGRGVPQNMERAVKLLKRAAWMGDVDGQATLGLVYERGMGVAKDYLEARRLYTLASAQGDAGATDA